MNAEKLEVESVRVVDPPLLLGGTSRVARPQPAPQGKSHWWVWVIILAALATGLYFGWPYLSGLLGSGGAMKKKRTAPLAPVVVGTARRGDMPIYLDELGTVTPLNTVTIHTRVDGELDKIEFVEGQTVHQGDLLAEIDPRPFQVQLLQAQGALARDQALLQNGKADLERYQSAREAVSQQQLDTAAAQVAQYEGNLKTDQAQIESAKLQLTYCEVRAPLTGRIGLRQVDQGNIVHASDVNGLAVITQLQPIAVLFSVPQDNLPQIMSQMSGGLTLTVDAYNRDLTQKLAKGTLLATDSQIDQATGKLKFKAVFSNENNALFPNQFVNARLLVDTKKNVVIVPAAAVQISPTSRFVYVAKLNREHAATQPAETGEVSQPAEDAGPNGASAGKAGGQGRRSAGPTAVVEMRPVTVGPQEGDEIVINSGIEAGELVVTDGVDKLQDKAEVTIGRTDRPATTQSGQDPAIEAAEANGDPAAVRDAASKGDDAAQSTAVPGVTTGRKRRR